MIVKNIFLGAMALCSMAISAQTQVSDCKIGHYDLRNDDIVMVPEINIQFIWNGKYAELYVLQMGKYWITEVDLDGMEFFTNREAGRILAVYGIAQMEWEDEKVLFLAKVDDVCYYADVAQFDDHVELRILAGEKVIFEKSWFS